MADADETIITQFIVDAANAVEDAAKFREQIDAAKVALREMVDQGKGGFKELATAMISLEKTRLADKINEIKTAFQNIDTSKLQELTGKEFKINITSGKFTTEAKEQLKASLAEAKAEYQLYVQSVRQGLQEINAEEKALAQVMKKEKVDAIKSVKVAQDEYVKVTKQGYGVMSKEAQQYGARIREIKTEIQNLAKNQGMSFNQAAQQLVAAGVPIKDVNIALKELMKQSEQTGTSLQTLGKIAQYVFASVFGLTVLSVLRQVVDYLKEATKVGLEFSQSLYALAVSTRALQRQGLDVSIRETFAGIKDLRREFKIFSQQELVAGVANVQLLTRNFGYSKEQIDQMTRATAEISILTGKDFNEAARGLALFLASGYSESLQRAGLNVNKARVEHEALLLGIRKAYVDMTGEEKAAAGLVAVMKELEGVSEDVTKITDELAGQSRAADARFKDLTRTIGELLTPAWTKVKEAAGGVANFFTRLLGETLPILGAKASKAFIPLIVLIQEFFRILQTGDIRSFEEVMAEISKRAKEVDEQLKSILETGSLIPSSLGDVEVEVKVTGIDEEELLPAIEDLYEKLTDAQRKYASDIARIERDLQNDLERIDRDGARRRAEIFRDYLRKRQEIALDGARQEEEARLRAQIDIAQAIRQFNLRRQELEAQYRERQIKAEIEYQERLRRLREEFLFDLEDALRERDALQVLRLVRRFNLERDQLERERQQQRDELRREYELELAELERQREERIRILNEELNARIEAIRLATEYEREELRRKFEQQKQDEARSEREKEEERKLRHKEQMDEEAIRLEERNRQILDAFMGQYDITVEMAEKIKGILQEKFGMGGEVDAIYDYMIEKMNAVTISIINNIARIVGIIKSLYNFDKSIRLPKGSSSTSTTTTSSSTPYAEGGTLIATEPTTATFGEAGAEMVTFTPLTKIGDNQNKVFMNNKPMEDFGMSEQGKVAIELFLSPDLRYEIIDDTLGQVAGVMFNVGRKRQ